MSKNKAGKQALAAIALSLAVEGVCLLLLSWAGSRGWVDPQHLLPAVIAATVAASAAGSYLLTAKKWSAVPTGLICGLATQLILLLAGYLIFGGVELGAGKWSLLMIAFLSAILLNLFAGKRTGKKKRSRKGQRRKR